MPFLILIPILLLLWVKFALFVLVPCAFLWAALQVMRHVRVHVWDDKKFRPKQILPAEDASKAEVEALFHGVENALNSLQTDGLEKLARREALESLHRAIKARRTDSQWSAPSKVELKQVFFRSLDEEEGSAQVRVAGRRKTVSGWTVFAEDWSLEREEENGWVLRQRERVAQ